MISPYLRLSDKAKSNNPIQLIENDRFISDPLEVAEFFNTKYATVADSIGSDSKYSTDLSNHPSFSLISKHVQSLGITEDFNFKPTTVHNVSKILSGLNATKPTGYDGIPPKALKASSNVMAPTVCNMVNNMVEQSLFPDPLKRQSWHLYINR